jgi:mutator protein MutT
MGKEYPVAPVVAVGAVVVRDGRALIVRRAHEPLRGRWSLPGGVVELGERLVDAVRREVQEETGLHVDVGPVVETFDRIDREPDGRVRFHFVIVDFVCHAPRGEALPGTDAEAVAWVTAGDLEGYGVSAHASEVIRKGLASAMMPR